MAGYIGMSISVNAMEAYANGKKPVSSITKEDILKRGISEGIDFFRWYVKKYCRSCEWHHTSAKYNQTSFYDIEECCNLFKKAAIEKLKSIYREQKKPKSDTSIDETPYYARIEYSISTYSGSRKYLETYAVIHKCWAYFHDEYKKKIAKKRLLENIFSLLKSIYLDQKECRKI